MNRALNGQEWAGCAVYWMDQDGGVHWHIGTRTKREAIAICRRLRRNHNPRVDKVWVAGRKYGRDVALF